MHSITSHRTRTNTNDFRLRATRPGESQWTADFDRLMGDFAAWSSHDDTLAAPVPDFDREGDHFPTHEQGW